MGKLIFAVVVFVVGFAVYSALKRQTLLTGPMAVIAARLVLAFTIGIPLLIVLFSVFRIIPAGHVGVKVLFGQVEQQPLREGLNVVLNPLYDVVDMDVRVVKHAARYDAASKDLQAVHVEMVLNYRVMPDRAPEVYRNIGPNFSSVIIDPAAQEVLKANTATHNAEEILLQRPQIKADVQRDLTACRGADTIRDAQGLQHRVATRPVGAPGAASPSAPSAPILAQVGRVDHDAASNLVACLRLGQNRWRKQ